MEVGVVLAGQRMKTLNIRLFLPYIFHLYHNRVVWGLLSLSELRYCYLIIMGNLAGSEERSVDLLHNRAYDNNIILLMHNSPKTSFFLYKEGSSLLHNYHGKASVQPLN